MTSIEKNVMASVRVIHGARLLMSRRALMLYAFLLSFGALSVLVSLPHIAANFAVVVQGGLGSVSFFIVDAVAHTQPMVQVMFLVCTLALAAVAADMARSIVVRQPMPTTAR